VSLSRFVNSSSVENASISRWHCLIGYFNYFFRKILKAFLHVTVVYMSCVYPAPTLPHWLSPRFQTASIISRGLREKSGEKRGCEWKLKIIVRIQQAEISESSPTGVHMSEPTLARLGRGGLESGYGTVRKNLSACLLQGLAFKKNVLFLNRLSRRPREG
jgi:hypothetical protein